MPTMIVDSRLNTSTNTPDEEVDCLLGPAVGDLEPSSSIALATARPRSLPLDLDDDRVIAGRRFSASRSDVVARHLRTAAASPPTASHSGGLLWFVMSRLWATKDVVRLLMRRDPFALPVEDLGKFFRIVLGVPAIRPGPNCPEDHHKAATPATWSHGLGLLRPRSCRRATRGLGGSEGRRFEEGASFHSEEPAHNTWACTAQRTFRRFPALPLSKSRHSEPADHNQSDQKFAR